MRKIIRNGITLLMILLLCACSSDTTSNSHQKIPPAASSQETLPSSIMAAYYDASEDQAFTYLQKKRIQEFMTMWIKEELSDFSDPVFDYDTLIRIEFLDHELQDLRPDEALYSLTFSDGNQRNGCIIVQYHEDGPAISNISIEETTPLIYDLKANQKAIGKALATSGMKMDNASARRVNLLDAEKKRTDQVILFTDAADEQYICNLNDPAYEIRKWP